MISWPIQTRAGYGIESAGVKTIAPLNAEQTAEYIRARMTALGHWPCYC